MKLTGRSDEHIALVKEYLKQNHMFFDVEKEDPTQRCYRIGFINS